MEAKPQIQPTKKRTLEEAIDFAEKSAAIRRALYMHADSENHQQIADWLRELQTLRAAMNMEPHLVTG